MGAVEPMGLGDASILITSPPSMDLTIHPKEVFIEMEGTTKDSISIDYLSGKNR